MKINITNNGKDDKQVEIVDYVKQILTPAYSNSDVVIAQKTVDNVLEAFGRLCDILLESNVISLHEFNYVVKGRLG